MRFAFIIGLLIITEISFGQADCQTADCEIQAWAKAVEFIPKETNRCVPNMTTRLCDEGNGILERLSEIEASMKSESQLKLWSDIYSRFYQYKMGHETGKLNEFIAQYEAAVRPTGVVSKFIVNDLRGNDKRTDGKVYANCVGPREELQGKCDLVFKHHLVTRIINQAMECERIAQNDDRIRMAEVIIKYLTELKSMVEARPEIRSDLFPTYQKMNFDQAISEYRRKL
ncbi:MAG: hypothetical protein BroJett040_19190 [Oligoflexia bacterium]|nr:MAG: hypothetical protein BroJett040_19190 [Oligoflexia bacterium]